MRDYILLLSKSKHMLTVQWLFHCLFFFPLSFSLFCFIGVFVMIKFDYVS